MASRKYKAGNEWANVSIIGVCEMMWTRKEIT